MKHNMLVHRVKSGEYLGSLQTSTRKLFSICMALEQTWAGGFSFFLPQKNFCLSLEIS